MENILIYGAFTFSMVCVVAYFAIPAFKKMKESRNRIDPQSDKADAEQASDDQTDADAAK